MTIEILFYCMVRGTRWCPNWPNRSLCFRHYFTTCNCISMRGASYSVEFYSDTMKISGIVLNL